MPMLLFGKKKIISLQIGPLLNSIMKLTSYSAHSALSSSPGRRLLYMARGIRRE